VVKISNNTMYCKNNTPNIVEVVDKILNTPMNRASRLLELYQLEVDLKRPLFYVKDKYSHRKRYSDIMYVKHILNSIRNPVPSHIPVNA
jgi:hypothetical protein